MHELTNETPHLIELIAGAIREALGEEIDAYPGGREPEQADPLNRAFRAVVASLLRRYEMTAPALVSTTLRCVAEKRLAADGFDVQRALDEEPGSPDDWLAFLILSSRQQVADALKSDDTDPL